MKSVTTPKFRRALEKLPARIQRKARKTYKQWKHNPQHPSLEFKQIHSRERIYAVRVGLGYRALGVIKMTSSFGFGSDLMNTITN